jgi:hypothetical protein
VKPYSELVDVMVYCTDCHGDRRAESGIRFNSYDEAVRGADRGAQAIADGSMPPGGGHARGRAAGVLRVGPVRHPGVSGDAG